MSRYPIDHKEETRERILEAADRIFKEAGVDLSQPETVQAVVEQLDVLVTQLEHAVAET